MKEYNKERTVGIVTGFAAKELMEETAAAIEGKFPSVKVLVYAIRNDFFGGEVTVSGLVCGCDVMAQLGGEKLPRELLMPEVMFRAGTDTMLDDVEKSALEQKLNVKIKKIKTDGFSTVDAILEL